MGVRKSTLSHLKQSQALLDVWCDHLSHESLTGVLSDYSDQFIYLSLFSDSGLPNGIAVSYLSDITRIRWGGNARESIQQLITANQAEPMVPTLDLSSMQQIVQSVQGAFGYVNLLTERSRSDVTYIGSVDSIDAETVVLYEFGTMDTRDRHYLMLGLSEISRVDAGASYENSIYFLHQRCIKSSKL